MYRRVGFKRILRAFRGNGLGEEVLIHVDSLGETLNEFGSRDHTVSPILPEESYEVHGVLVPYDKANGRDISQDAYEASHILYVERNNRYFDSDYVMFKRAMKLPSTPSELEDLYDNIVAFSGNWVDTPNIVDSDDTTYATSVITLGELLSSIDLSLLPLPTDLEVTDILSKIEIGIKYEFSSAEGYDSEFKMVPQIGGSPGDTYFLPESAETWIWFDVTNDAESPETWTFADATNMQIKLEHQGTAPVLLSSVNLFQVKLKLSYNKWITTTGRPIFDTETIEATATILDTEDGLVEIQWASDDAEVYAYVDKMAVKSVSEVDEHYIALYLGAGS